MRRSRRLAVLITAVDVDVLLGRVAATAFHAMR
jgi:hypothetical protein